MSSKAPEAPSTEPQQHPDTTSYRLRARIGAHTLHATHDPKVTTSAARRAFLDRFEREADPDGVLPAEERVRRARHLRTAYFTRLALKSAQARRRRARRQNGGAS